jgi:hypothetical protein
MGPQLRPLPPLTVYTYLKNPLTYSYVHIAAFSRNNHSLYYKMVQNFKGIVTQDFRHFKLLLLPKEQVEKSLLLLIF